MKRGFCIPVLIVCCILCSCGKKNKPEKQIEETPATAAVVDHTINSISALYYNYVVEDDAPVTPESVQKNIPDFASDRKGVLDAVITDSAKLARIQVLVRSLQASEQQSPVDARIMLTLGYKDGTKGVLCIGGRYTDRIYLDGVQQQTDNKLLFLIKNYIGFYPWLIGDDMFQMSEMKDNSFPKEPFVSTFYYKEYQAALAQK